MANKKKPTARATKGAEATGKPKRGKRVRQSKEKGRVFAKIGDVPFRSLDEYYRAREALRIAREEQAALAWAKIIELPGITNAGLSGPHDALPTIEILLAADTGLTAGLTRFPTAFIYELARESQKLRDFAVHAREQRWDIPAANGFWLLAKMFVLTGFPETSWLNGPGRWPAEDFNRALLGAALSNDDMFPPSTAHAVELVLIPGPDSKGEVWRGNEAANVGGPAFRLNVALPDAVLMEDIKTLIKSMRELLKIPPRGRGRPVGSSVDAVNNPERVAEQIAILRRSRSPSEHVQRKELAGARRIVERAVEIHLAKQIGLVDAWRKATGK